MRAGIRNSPPGQTHIIPLKTVRTDFPVTRKGVFHIMRSPPRTPAPPAQAHIRPHWTVRRRFDGTRSAEELIRSLLAAHLT